MIDLSKSQAQKLAYNGQFGCVSNKTGLAGTLNTINHLGYIQIDCINVFSRAHHQTLFNRVKNYDESYIDKLIKNRQIFEYWSHAASYLPINDYRYCLVNMHEIKANKQRLWYPKNEKLMQHVLCKLKDTGPMQAKDFTEHKNTGETWQSSPVKQALEHLFMQGDIMVHTRKNFQKIFDLTERVLPNSVNTTKPSVHDYAEHIIIRYLKANGIARVNEFSYLRASFSKAIKRTTEQLRESRRILLAKIGHSDENYYVLPEFENLLNKQPPINKLRILSPFDNHIIQRDRIERLYDFNYQLECYKPKTQRVHGYFVMPILWRNKLIARMDAKAHRKQRTIEIKNLTFEKHVNQLDAFKKAFESELQRIGLFINCNNIITSPDINVP